MRYVSFPSYAVGLLVAIATMGEIVWNAPSAAAQEFILQVQGNLEPLLDKHTFSGTAGQKVVISLLSTGFNGTLTVLAPNGTEIINTGADSLDPTVFSVFLSLPNDGEYTIVARSPFGVPGDYTIQVRVATLYDEVYALGHNLFVRGDYQAAIAVFMEAISLDPNQPMTYVDLAGAIYNEATRLQPNELEVLISNYLRVAELYEQQGNVGEAERIRHFVVLLQEGNAEGLIEPFQGSIEYLTENISPGSDELAAHLLLAGTVYDEATRLQPNELEAVTSNLLQAAKLYEQQGKTDPVESIQDFLMFLHLRSKNL